MQDSRWLRCSNQDFAPRIGDKEVTGLRSTETGCIRVRCSPPAIRSGRDIPSTTAVPSWQIAAVPAGREAIPPPNPTVAPLTSARRVARARKSQRRPQKGDQREYRDCGSEIGECGHPADRDRAQKKPGIAGGCGRGDADCRGRAGRRGAENDGHDIGEAGADQGEAGDARGQPGPRDGDHEARGGDDASDRDGGARSGDPVQDYRDPAREEGCSIRSKAADSPRLTAAEAKKTPIAPSTPPASMRAAPIDGAAA